MNYFKSILAGALCCLLLFSGCSNDNDSDVAPDNGSDNSTEFSFTVKNFQQGTSSESRTAIVFSKENPAGNEFVWTAGDTIGVAPNEGSQVYFVINESSANSSTASFSGGAWDLKPDESSNYAAYYPFIGDIYLNRKKVPVDYRGQVYRPATDAKLTSLASHDFMAAKPSVAESADKVDFTFDHLGALVEVQFTPDTTGTIVEVALTAESAVLPYRGSFDLTDETIAIAYGDDDKTNMIPVAVKDMKVTQGESTSVFFMMPPMTIPNKQLYFRVKYEDDSTRLYKINEDKALEANCWSVLTTEEAMDCGVMNLDSNADFAVYLAEAIDETGANRIKFVTSSPVVSDISWNVGDCHAYAVKNGEWLEVHTLQDKIVAADIARHMFSSSYNLPFKDIVEFDFTGFDTSRVTDMFSMFNYCTRLVSITFSDDFDTSNVTDMFYMFHDCISLASITFGTNFDTSNVTSMYSMFNGCSSLTSLTFGDDFDTSNVTDMSNMFASCHKLASITFGKNFDVSKVKDMASMFNECKSLVSLDLSNFNTVSAKYMNYMFAGCLKLATITLGDGFDTTNVKSTYDMFSGCQSLVSLDLSQFNTASVTDMRNMFLDCSSLASITLGEEFDTSNVTDMGYMFSGCSALTSLDLSGFDFGSISVKYTDGFEYMLDKLGSEESPVIVYVKDEADKATLQNSTAINPESTYVTLEVK